MITLITGNIGTGKTTVATSLEFYLRNVRDRMVYCYESNGSIQEKIITLEYVKSKAMITGRLPIQEWIIVLNGDNKWEGPFDRNINLMSYETLKTIGDGMAEALYDSMNVDGEMRKKLAQMDKNNDPTSN